MRSKTTQIFVVCFDMTVNKLWQNQHVWLNKPPVSWNLCWDVFESKILPVKPILKPRCPCLGYDLSFLKLVVLTALYFMRVSGLEVNHKPMSPSALSSSIRCVCVIFCFAALDVWCQETDTYHISPCLSFRLLHSPAFLAQRPTALTVSLQGPFRPAGLFLHTCFRGDMLC